ncbi:hypothetical protein BpHYR1_034265 [Brachionus plicatilis]|uniref:Uncharacterized protein n=1 Tax=Brachionus plicatilis TaxID=10195 RepID=A0A3M7R4B3_BRAPC|nr:hypothetical protein BpHYR1_034265 [Brachionus plicatilis]
MRRAAVFGHVVIEVTEIARDRSGIVAPILLRQNLHLNLLRLRLVCLNLLVSLIMLNMVWIHVVNVLAGKKLLSLDIAVHVLGHGTNWNGIECHVVKRQYIAK